jgi:integrating conjugative element protein (TIGR03759 family)
LRAGVSNALLLPLAVALAATPLSPSHAGEQPAPATQTAGTEIVRTDRINLSRSDITRAQAWGLSETEWRRYQSLMQGIRGSVSPDTISPLEVLGIHARDEAERRRYAELWAQAMWENAERILAFQRAYVEAGRRLYPGIPLIDPNRLPEEENQAVGLAPQDRVLFFTRPDCDACDAMLARLLGRIDRIAGIDIYLAEVDRGDDQAVHDWAAQHGIDPEWVRTRKVTLNFEAGALAALTGGRGKIPSLMRRRGEDLALLSPAGL